MSFQHFVAGSAALEDSNLIEASAGTGKTYSIAILLLRLLLEKGIGIKEVLMVTFTKAAVAELEERSRLFVRLAWKASRGEVIKDQKIAALVENAIRKSEREKVERLLKDAVIFLDETSVMTIHGFCQQTLTEFAFETGQLFGADTLQDTLTVIQEQADFFWRENVTTISAELLGLLIGRQLSRQKIVQAAKEHLGGKRYLGYDAVKDYSFCAADYVRILNELSVARAAADNEAMRLYDYVNENRQALISQGKSKWVKDNAIPLIDNAEAFIACLHANHHLKSPQKDYEQLLEQIESWQELAAVEHELVDAVIDRLLCLAIGKIKAGVEKYKQSNNLLSFDDMIVNLHEVLCRRENPKLVAALQKKYKAVFIDEFQDTDKLQYEIFQRAFGINTTLFFIADPKQSIYAWRKADIFTYFRAYADAAHLYEMNDNYRSSSAYIEAMNLFFKPREGFDTFYFGGAADSIIYRNITSPIPNTHGELLKNGNPDIPFTVYRNPNKNDICQGVAAQIAILLDGETYQIAAPQQRRSVKPSDIGILVRSNNEAKAIKAALSGYGIPAVTIDDSRILQSEESRHLMHVLEAIADPTPGSINKAILSPFTGFSVKDILAINDEYTTVLFRKYRDIWDKKGIYPSLMAFVRDFGIRGHLLSPQTKNGERIISNLFQLIELLHKVQNARHFSEIELISWLHRGIEGMVMTGDEYEQHIESDEESVKIVTIHASKGLQYNIVLAPFLDFLSDNKHEFCSFRDADTGEYVGAEKNKLSTEQLSTLKLQAEQENRRLLYVAVTRAVYKCFIFKNTWHSFKSSTLSVFLNELSGADVALIENAAPPAMISGYRYNSNKTILSLTEKTVDFELQHNSWTRMSYSGLSQGHDAAGKPRAAPQADLYDHFIFSQLIRGRQTGDMLHYIFERIQFNDNSRWQQVIDEAVRLFYPAETELYGRMLYQMASHVFTADIPLTPPGFKLADIIPGRRIHEFEFDFNVGLFQLAQLGDLSDSQTHIYVKNIFELEGIMNGKMDLFFEHDGKYYLLDWKSNYLGDKLAHYEAYALNDAMNNNNYHLQYLIYTLAAKKYLESRLPGFNYEKDFGGVIYLFLRGIRANSTSGIFCQKPQHSLLMKLEEILQPMPTAFD